MKAFLAVVLPLAAAALALAVVLAAPKNRDDVHIVLWPAGGSHHAVQIDLRREAPESWRPRLFQAVRDAFPAQPPAEAGTVLQAQTTYSRARRQLRWGLPPWKVEHEGGWSAPSRVVYAPGLGWTVRAALQPPIPGLRSREAAVEGFGAALADELAAGRSR